MRAESREDRVTWVEALQAVKELFPRMSNSELIAPVEKADVSTDKLRQRLLEEGVNEDAIQDIEHIMKTEFYVLYNQLVVLKQRQVLLLDTLRHLEVYTANKKFFFFFFFQFLFLCLELCFLGEFTGLALLVGKDILLGSEHIFFFPFYTEVFFRKNNKCKKA